MTSRPARLASRFGARFLEPATLSLLLALSATVLIGYRYGDSNHGISVPILKSMMDPSLYPGDIVVKTTESYGTVFYWLLAHVLPDREAIPAAFFVLYVASLAATFAGIYRIGRWAGGPAAGLLAVAVAFPVRIGLAGATLYRSIFSHADLATALSVWALAWFLEGRRVLPLLVLSLGAYNHLLFSAYLLVPLSLVALSEMREVGRRAVARALLAAIVPLVPLAVWMLAHATPLTDEWLRSLLLRSAHHSLPSAFSDQLADAAWLLALGALAASRLDAARLRLVAVFLCGIALQFVLGTVFTEWVPLKAALQYQPHRSWRYAMLLLQALAAGHVVAGWREGGLARLVAAATAAVLLTPGLDPLLPLVVLAQAAVDRPRAAVWARALALACLAGVSAAPARLAWPELGRALPYLLTTVVLHGGVLAVLVSIGRRLGDPARFAVSVAAAGLTLAWIAPDAWGRARARYEGDAWFDLQRWALRSTPRQAAFVTPPEEAGFRVFSERTIVGEWKDGTQQYFDDAFAREWAERMQRLGGAHYPELSDDALLETARRYGASYIVLPLKARREALAEAYRNPRYVVHHARPPARPQSKTPGP